MAIEHVDTPETDDSFTGGPYRPLSVSSVAQGGSLVEGQPQDNSGMNFVAKVLKALGFGDN